MSVYNDHRCAVHLFFDGKYRFQYNNKPYVFKTQEKVHQFFLKEYQNNKLNTVHFHLGEESYYVHFSLGEPERIDRLADLRQLLSLEGDGVWSEKEGKEKHYFMTTMNWPVFRYREVSKEEIPQYPYASMMQKTTAIALAGLAVAPGVLEWSQRVLPFHSQVPLSGLIVLQRDPLVRTFGLFLMQSSLAAASQEECLKTGSCQFNAGNLNIPDDMQPQEKAQHYQTLAQEEKQKFNFGKALAHSLEAYKILEQHPEIFLSESQLLRSSLDTIIYCYILEEKYDILVSYIEKALKEKTSRLGGEAALDFAAEIDETILGVVRDLVKKDEVSKALEISYKILRLLQSHLKREDASVRLAIACTNQKIGSIYILKNKNQEAFSYLNKALNEKTALLGVDHFSTASTYDLLGKNAIASRETDKGFNYYYQALQVMKTHLESEDPRILGLILDIADSYQTVQDFSKAIDYYLDAHRIAAKKLDLQEKFSDFASIQTRIGDCYYKSWDIRHALDLHIMALFSALQSASLKRSGTIDVKLTAALAIYNYDNRREYKWAEYISSFSLDLADERIVKLLYQLGEDYDWIQEKKRAAYFYDLAFKTAKNVHGSYHRLTLDYERRSEIAKKSLEPPCTIL